MPTGARSRLLLVPYRVLRARRRLFYCMAVGMAVGAALCGLATWRPLRSVLIGWDVTVVLYLAVAIERMVRSQPGDIRRHAAEQDEGRLALLVLTVTAGLASLAVIVLELGASTGRKPGQIFLAGITTLLSWAFIHMIFALHYAHQFYGEDEGMAAGLAFPGGDEEPDYWDFAYFSFIIGMTSQVSDVGITSRRSAAPPPRTASSRSCSTWPWSR